MKLYDNPQGFSVQHTNPFRVFPLLQEVARGKNALEDIVDLSRGDPGFGFAPSVRGREFLSFLLFLDGKLNNTKRLFADSKKEDEAQILEEIATWAHAAYVPALATRTLQDLSEFIQRCVKIAQEFGKEMSPYDVLFEIFRNSTVSGGTYHHPQGESLVRMIVAWWHRKTITTPLDPEDIVFTSGASHAIGTLFKLLGHEGLQYLNPGDKVVVSSPVYTPYNTILDNRALETLSISMDPVTGKIEPKALEKMKKLKNVKLILVIDPNNPTGFSMDEETLKILADFANQQDALIISDEVYSGFLEGHQSIVDFCPERTLRIQARSKIERSTGLRFGDVLITKAANTYLTEQKLKEYLPQGQDFKTAFMYAKGPGGIQGEFFHTTFVTGPDQYLGAAHILLGESERQRYREWLVENTALFGRTLGLPHQGNIYYTIFDLNEVPGCVKQDVAPEQKIIDLAELGVILLPANLFFSEEDRKAKPRLNYVRASLANASPEKVKLAAEMIRDYLTH